MAKPSERTEEERRYWADLTHIAFLDALMTKSGLAAREIAFQGGTSLHLSWRSPRFSEDLDFLIAQENPHQKLIVAMPAIKKRIERFMVGAGAAHGALSEIEIIDKTKDPNRLIVFDLRLSPVARIDKVRGKAEFWRVPKDYLSRYDTVLKMPTWQSEDLIGRVESASPINTGTLKSIMADKMVAMAYRPRVKWRDIFDVWWLNQHLSALTKEGFATLTERVLWYAQAYTGPNAGLGLAAGPNLAAGLRKFLSQKDVLLAQKGLDLFRWLPRSVARMMLPDHVEEMVGTAMEYAQGVLNEIEAQDDDLMPDSHPTRGPLP